ncbi:MAG: hypothetical protein AB7S26_01210 [Sandaracinaceae bacterium]
MNALRREQLLSGAAIVALVGIGVGLVLSPRYALQVAGVALFITACLSAAHVLREPATALWDRYRARWPRLSDATPGILLALAACGFLWPCFIGRVPYGHDHPVHITRAWHFVTQELAHGRLRGWSDLWFAGWPAGEDYGMGGDLWITLFYLPTFGLLGWRTTYALAFVGAFVLYVIAHYVLARRAFGPAAGFIAGLFALLERGGGREGGWIFAVDTGVWPQTLATAFVLFAFALLDPVIKRGHARDWLALCACIGFSIIAHPFSVVWYGLGAPLFLLARAALGEEAPGRAVVRAGLAFAIGGALSAFWLLPFVTKGAWFYGGGEIYRDLQDTANRMWTGTVFAGFPPLLSALAIFGGALALAKKRYEGVFLLALLAIATFVMSRDAIERLDLAGYAAGFANIQYERFAYIGKPCATILGAYAMSALFAGGFVAARSTLRAFTASGLVGVVLAPLLVPFMIAWGAYLPLMRVATIEDFPDHADYMSAFAWIREQHESSDAYFRVAYLDQDPDTHMTLTAIMHTETPSLTVGFTPATTYLYKFARNDPALFEVLNVRYAVVRGEERRPGFAPVQQFGRVRIYELESYTPQRYTLEGPGEVEVHTFDPGGDGMELTVRGASERSRLILHVGNWANWRAWHDGEPAAIHTASLAGHEGFISVRARDGDWRFDTVSPPANVVGNLVSLAALALLVVFLIAWRWPHRLQRWTARPLALLARIEERGVLVAGVAIVLVAVFVLVKVARAPLPERRDFASQLERAEVAVVNGDDVAPCVQAIPGRHQCSDAEWNYVGIKYQWMADEDGVLPTDGRLRRCIWAHPVQGKQLRIRFPGIPMGRAIVLGHGLLATGAGVMTITARVGDEELGHASPQGRFRWSEARFETPELEGQTRDLDFVVEAERGGTWHYCFAADVERSP